MSLEFSTKEELVAKVEELRRELSRVDGVEKAHRELRKKYDNLKRDHEKLEDQHEELKKQHQDMQRDVWAAIEDGALDEQMWKSEDVMTGAWLLKLHLETHECQQRPDCNELAETVEPRDDNDDDDGLGSDPGSGDWTKGWRELSVEKGYVDPSYNEPAYNSPTPARTNSFRLLPSALVTAPAPTPAPLPLQAPGPVRRRRQRREVTPTVVASRPTRAGRKRNANYKV